MKPLFIKIFFVILLPLAIPLLAYSGENLEGAMRAQQQRQQMLQQQAVARQVAQQRAAIVQQQQRMIQERQQTLQQQAYQQAVQQKQMIQQQRAIQNQAYNKAYQQKVAQEIFKKQTVQQLAYEQAVQQRNQQAAYVQSAKEQLLASQAALQSGAAQYSPPAYHPSAEADQVSDLEHIWKDLEISTEIWPLIMDREPKELTVERFIEAYRKNGIAIRKPASTYIDIIDSMTSEPGSPMLKTPFKDVLKVAAIIEYDFDNGLDKDQMALKVLGEKSFESNKKRLGR